MIPLNNTMLRLAIVGKLNLTLVRVQHAIEKNTEYDSLLLVRHTAVLMSDDAEKFVWIFEDCGLSTSNALIRQIESALGISCRNIKANRNSLENVVDMVNPDICHLKIAA